MNLDLTTVFIYSYILGSIPFGLLITKFFLKEDIRDVGSGNIGATNVLRTGNKTIGYTTLILDVVKAVTPVIYVKFYFPEFLYISSLCAFLGHVFPIWLKFKGGKGVATYLGVLFALSLSLSLLFIFTWITVSLIFRYSSLSSMFSTLTVCIVNLVKYNAVSVINKNLVDETNLTFILFVFLILIIFTHRRNIINLKNKSEKKIKI